MNISAGWLGVLRGILYVVVAAVVSYLADASHLTGVLNPSLVLLITAIMGGLEHKMEANGQGALFGAVRS